MAGEYLPVLKSLGTEVAVVGNTAESVRRFNKETGIQAISGGIEAFLKGTETDNFETAIVAVPILKLSETTDLLLNAGIKKILVEKPGAICRHELEKTSATAKKKNAKVYIAYNRRFYSSTAKAKEIIEEDGGVTSFNFEFTEWSHIIESLQKDSTEKKEWFLANSTHVVDLAFYLGGKPSEMECFAAGTSEWHPGAMIYAGAGRTQKGALFSYSANWSAPGRWGVEILTEKHRLYFRPLEKLQVQDIGTVKITDVEIDDEWDSKFKPGIFNQIKSFFSDGKGLKPIDEQLDDFLYYQRIEAGKSG